MYVASLFPERAVPPSSAPIATSLIDSWTWTITEHAGATRSLCHFSTSAFCTSGSSSCAGARHSESDPWDGRLPPFGSAPAKSVAVLASVPFGCVLHAATVHLLEEPDATSVLLITTAAEQVIHSNLSSPAEGGTPMEWIAHSTNPALKQALRKIDILHVNAIEELLAAITQTLARPETDAPSLLVCEGLSHLLQHSDVRQFTYIISLLHALNPKTQLLLIDNALDTLRLPLCPSLHKVGEEPPEDEERTQLHSYAPIALHSPPPQAYLQEVPCLPILFSRFDWMVTSSAVAVGQGAGGAQEGSDGQSLRLDVHPGWSNAIRRDLSASSGNRRADGQYHIDVVVKWT